MQGILVNCLGKRPHCKPNYGLGYAVISRKQACYT